MRAKWYCRMAGCLLLLVAGATSANAQSSSRATLRVTANVLTSTAVVFNDDGTAQIITANGPNGASITTVKMTVVPGQVSTLASGPGQTFTASSLIQPESNKTSHPTIVVPTVK